MQQVDVYLQKAIDVGADVGMKIVGAILMWIVGKWLIGVVSGVLGKAMNARRVDATLVRYLDSALRITLTVVLIIAVLGIFGVETTSFAAVLAAAGVAIGMAWSGLLSNLAAGVFMVVLRPFKVGDYVVAGGVEGTIETIGLFVTAIDTPDNVRTYVGNNAIFSGTIRNFSTNPFRRVERTAQLSHEADYQDAIRRLRAKLAAIPNVMQNPAPSVEVLDFTLAGPVIAVRPFCHNDHYWQDYFDTNRAIKDVGGEAGYPVPEQHVRIQPFKSLSA